MLGVVPQEIALYDGPLGAREPFLLGQDVRTCAAKALSTRVDEVLEVIGLTDRPEGAGGILLRRDEAARQHRRGAAAQAAESSSWTSRRSGSTRRAAAHILDDVKELDDQGMTVLYTTHYMEEAEELSDRIAIMDQGKVIACGTNAELVRLVGERTASP